MQNIEENAVIRTSPAVLKVQVQDRVVHVSTAPARNNNRRGTSNRRGR